ncbi:MAG: PKD domain-containing protein, partial [Bacteroidales bacterium]|nr:PKD domain-containing protein [Bacteroidales bacterium]
TGFSNLPEGLSYCVSRVDLDPTTNVYATIHITGTAPSENGDFDLELSGVFTGTASAMGMSMPLTNQSVSFATGIVLTIGEGTDVPEPSEIVCDDPCPAVTNQPMSQTTIPYYAPEELTYNVNEAVDVCITIQCPANTNVEYMGMQAAATITSLTITGFTNLPEGLSYCVSRVDMDPTTNNFATLHLTGTPTTAGEYNLNLSCNVTGTANVFGSDMPLNNQAITFPTGIVVTIEEETSNPVVANFTSNPEATQLLGGSAIYITAGETITYTNTSENATSIAWTFEGGNPATSTENTVTVTYATAGNYTTTLTAYGENNEQNTKTVGVNVSAVPTPVFNVDFTADVTTIETGETVHFTNNTTVTLNDEPYTGTVHYQWLFNANYLLRSDATSTEENPSYTYETAGVYTVALAASDDEIMIHEIAGGWYPVKIKEDYIIVTDPVSVDESAISEINVYPNPTSSVINISAEGMQNITIIDMTGRVVMSKDVNSNFETISAEGFAKANYMVRIATADGVVVKNIVVE